MQELVRYSLIKTKMPRELILLQGRGCKWKKCIYCDYYNDISSEPFNVNKSVIKNVTGKYSTLDVINSGSAMELDCSTIELLRKIVKECGIHTLWFEAHWMYRNKLDEFAKLFPGTDVKFRIGVETFEPHIRSSWNKGIPAYVKPEDIAKYFKGVCLLVGIEGQTEEMVRSDIEIARKYFEYFSINIFIENSTTVKRNEKLINWFKKDIYNEIKNIDKIEILIDNTDLGVG